MTPYAALQAAVHYKNLGLDVLLIFDNVVEHADKEKLVYSSTNQPYSPIHIIKEIFNCSGYFGNEKGSLTSCLIVDTNKILDG